MRIDHYGIVVPSISAYLKSHLPPWLDAAAVGPLIHDPLQRANVAFLPAPGGRLELIEPASADSPVHSIIKRGLSLHHHVCFEVENLDRMLELCQNKGMRVVSEPKPAVAFGGRRISFVLGSDMLLWELLEAPAQSP